MATLKETQIQLEKLDASLQKLIVKAEALNAEMSSGNWGSQQVKDMAAQLDKINASISRIQGKRVKIIDDNNLRDFSILEKQIKTVQSNLNSLYSERNRVGQTMFGRMSDDFKEIESAIKRSETALKSLTSRSFTQFTPQGLRGTKGGAGSLGDVDLGSRLVSKGLTTEKELRDQLGILQESYDRLNQKANTTRAQSEFNKLATRIQSVSRDMDVLVGKILELEGARLRSDPGTRAWTTPDVGTNVPGGRTAGPAPATPPRGYSSNLFDKEFRTQFAGLDEKIKQDVIRAARALRRVDGSLVTISSLEQIPSGGFKFTGKHEVEGMPADFKAFSDAMGNYGRTLKELRRNQIINKYPELMKTAGQYGFSEQDLRRMRSSNAGAYQVAEFKRNVGGIDVQQEFNVDRQGGVQTATTQRKFQSFAQTVGKDLGDLLKWSIAISAIYGPINAISDAMAQLIENEAKLADVSIALNSDIADTGQIFDVVYQSAKGAGETVSEVIDAFGQAFRAAGRIGNQFERYNTSVTLLNDSLILSKLSTLDQAGAIDVLTAALYQSANAQDNDSEKLQRGSKLLDQWVRVSKVASVDIETLATGVAVLGDSAETAGLGLEQLNAMIATIAETSLAGGKEAANIAKALIGNYQQPNATKELNRLGIAVQDTTGKTRQFLDVMRDVAAMRSKGILGNEDFSRLTLALGGGGIRRQKDVSAFIENFGRMQQIVELQAGSEGEASQALSKKLDTVQTSATRLSNAFTSLAQSMGDEGGLLNAFSAILDLGTNVVEMLDGITSKIGKAAPLLLALGAGTFIFGRGNFTEKLATNLTIPAAQRFMSGPGTIGAGVSAAQYLTGQRPIFGQPGTALGRLGAAPSLAAIGLTAGQNLAEGNTEEAGANIAGGIAGALVGGPMGALIGSAIAEAFVRTTLTYDVQFADFFAGVIERGTEGGNVNVGKLSIDDLMKEAFKEIGGKGGEDFGKFIARQTFLESNPEYGAAAYGPETARKRAGKYPGQFISEEAAAMYLLEQQNPELAATLTSRFTAGGGQLPGTTTQLSERQQQISTPQTLEYLRGKQTTRQDELKTQLISGDIKPSEYARQMAGLSAYTVTATRYMAALGDQVGDLGPEFDSTTQDYDAFLQILSSGNDELIAQLNAQISAIEYYQELLKTWTPGTEIKNMLTGEMFTPEGFGDIEKMLDDVTAAFRGTAQFGAQQIRLQNLNIPDVYGGNINPTAQTDLQKVLDETKRVQDKRYSDLQPEDYDALKESFDEFAILVEKSGNEFYDKISGVDKSIFSEVYQQMQKEGKIAKQEGGPGFTELNITRPQLDEAVIRANQLAGNLQKKFGYEPNFEDVIVATSDEQVSKQHTDMKILQYILQQILDTEKKQLQGVYNLPEGANIFVPLEAALLAGAGAGGLGIEEGLGYKNPELVGGQAGYIPPEQRTMEELIRQDILRKPYTEPTKEKELTGPTGYEPGDKWWQDKIAPKTEAAVTPEETGVTSLLTQLITSIQNLFMPGGPFSGFGRDAGIGTGGGTTLPAETEPITTNLDIKFSSTTNLLVDGRVLASIVKPYLAADLLRTNESGGTVTRSYVI